MDGFDDPVNGHNGEWSVDDRVGATRRWTTYRGADGAGETVAVRTPTGAVSRERFERFETLARQWAAVDERRTVRSLRDWGTEPRPWVAVDAVEDELEALASGTTLEPARACDLATRGELLADVCDVLRTYARYGSTPSHRAVHPDCVSFRVDDEGPVAVVGDWGVSRLVDDPPPTPYTAPEQLDGDHAGRRTDVYRVGVLAAVLFSAESPFPAADADDAALRRTIRGGIDVDALAADLPDGAVEPIRRATARNPDDRYATTYPLGRDLRDAAPRIGAADRETGALVTTAAAGAAAAATDAAGDATDAAGDATGTGDATPADGTDADADSGTGLGAGESTPAAADDPEATPTGTDASGSRRTVLAYGAGILALGGVAGYATTRLSQRDDSTGGAPDPEPTSTDGSTAESDPAPEAETDSEAAITGGTVAVDVGYRQWLSSLPTAVADADVPDAVDVTVSSETRGPERITQFISRVDAGESTPDLLVVRGQELGALMAAEATEPFSAHAADHPIGETIGESFSAFTAAGRHPADGELHALAYAFVPDAVVYRTPAFERAGVQPDEWTTAPPTWSEWSSIVAEAADRGFVWNGHPSVLPSAFSGALAGFGGSYYATDDTAPAPDAPVTVDDPPGIQAANVFHDLVFGGDRSDRGIEQVSTEAVFDFRFVESRDRFRAGDAAAAMLPLSLVADSLPDAAVGVMPAPAGSDGSRTSAYPEYVVVNPNTDSLGEALAVAAAFRSAPVASLVVDGGWIPTMNGDPFSADAVASSPYASAAPAIRFAAERAAVEPPTELWFRSREAVGQRLREAIAGEPEAALRELAAYISDEE